QGVVVGGREGRGIDDVHAHRAAQTSAGAARAPRRRRRASARRRARSPASKKPVTASSAGIASNAAVRSRNAETPPVGNRASPATTTSRTKTPYSAQPSATQGSAGKAA